MRESLVNMENSRTFADATKTVVSHSVRANGNRSLGKNAKVSLFYGQPDAHRCMPSAPVITAAIQKDFGALRGTAIFRTTGCAAVPLSNRLLGVDRVMKQEQEIWKDIEGYDGKYQVSNLGRVRSFRIKSEGVVLVPRMDRCGYYRVRFCGKYRSLHRLVALAFVDGYREGLQVNHKNEKKDDNRACNLEWVTCRQNNLYGDRVARATKRTGERCSMAVKQFDLNGTYIRSYPSMTAAATAVGTTSSNICSCCKGKRGVAGGFRWSYKYTYKRVYGKVKRRMLQPRKHFNTTSLEGEEWRDAVGYEGKYQVSNIGRVKSLDHYDHRGVFRPGKILKQLKAGKTILLSRRLKVSLVDADNKPKKVLVHRIVAMAFCDGYSPDLQAFHIDGNTMNNRADNLKWVNLKLEYKKQ